MRVSIIFILVAAIVACANCSLASEFKRVPASAAPPAAATASVENEFERLDQATLNELGEDEERLDLYCLRKAYPGVKDLEKRGDGEKWLVTDDGRGILYGRGEPVKKDDFDNDFTTVAESMALPYPLDPDRPDFPLGNSPGRKRSKALMEWLYGNTKESVSKRLGTVKFRGKNTRLNNDALNAFKKAIPELDKLAVAKPSLKAYLEPSGGFNWRRIAGENRLSPHSYGIALDIGVSVSPYWRWAKINPHPAQKTYPPEIVRVMENNGFIWGGKWHEYDLMHFEYRPELICKANVKAALDKARRSRK